jgi:type IV secretion system protein VirB4
MALGPIALSFVGAAGKDDLKRIQQLTHDHGANWPKAWLTERGIGDAETILAHC